MRTTITIHDGLLEELKRRASETGSTVSRLIEDSVRLALATPRAPSEAAPFQLVTFGHGGRFPRLDLDRTWALLEVDDLERYPPGR